VEDCSRTGKIRNLCAKHFYATPEGQSVSIYQQEAAAAVAVTASSSGGSRRKSKSTDPPSSGGPKTY
jgi:hypothetical protein